MRVDVIMPQMGESIAEGTISQWLKKVGDVVQRDESLLEISTDKVDAEIPSPAEGRLVEIRHHQGETVPINTVIAVIETDVSRAVAPSAEAPSMAKGETVQAPQALDSPPSARPLAAPPTAPPPSPSKPIRSSPLVRRLAREHHVDLRLIPGTGLSGRVTKRDIMSYLENRAGVETRASEPLTEAPTAEAPAYQPGERVQIMPLTPMRKTIAERMILSRRTSAHVTTVFEIDMTHVVRLRESLKEEFAQRHGVKLTYMAFIAQACVKALKTFPIFNASLSGDNIVYKKDINLGIAVALDWGLIVPVVKQADEKSLLGLAKAIQDLADRARQRQLTPEEVQGGTFTITNPGGFGSLFGTPIINQPQVAILGVGRIVKRPIVTDEDAIAIRSMAYFALSFDHRLIDGAVADQFMSDMKRTLENWSTVEGPS